jgi:hypothetical protein
MEYMAHNADEMSKFAYDKKFQVSKNFYLTTNLKDSNIFTMKNNEFGNCYFVYCNPENVVMISLREAALKIKTSIIESKSSDFKVFQLE